MLPFTGNYYDGFSQTFLYHIAESIHSFVRMFVPTVIGNDHVKEGLLMVGANTGLPNIEMRTPKRMRLNALLIGDPGLSLIAQVSREDDGTYTLRLGHSSLPYFFHSTLP